MKHSHAASCNRSMMRGHAMRKKKGFVQAAPLRHHSGLIQKNARLNMTLGRRDHKQRLLWSIAGKQPMHLVKSWTPTQFTLWELSNYFYYKNLNVGCNEICFQTICFHQPSSIVLSIGCPSNVVSPASWAKNSFFSRVWHFLCRTMKPPIPSTINE